MQAPDSSYRHHPPNSVASTSSTTQLYSPSFSQASSSPALDEVLEDDINWDAADEDSDVAEERENDELFEQAQSVVDAKANSEMKLHTVGQDREDVLKMSLFKPKTHSKEPLTAIPDIFYSYLEHLDATEWMYPTPATFQPAHYADNAHLPPSATFSQQQQPKRNLDLPEFVRRSEMDWGSQMDNLYDVDPLRDLDHADEEEGARELIRDAAAELELSFSRPAGTAGLGGHLERGVSRLGMLG